MFFRETSWVASEWYERETLGIYVTSNEYKSSKYKERVRMTLNYLSTIKYLHSSKAY